MKALNFFTNGYCRTAGSIRMVFFVYTAYLLAGLLLAIPFLALARTAAGNSLLPEELMKGFDATALRELLASGGHSFLYFVKGLVPLMIAFLLLQVYLAGGMIGWVSNPRGRFRVRIFILDSNRYFFRFLKLTIWVLAWQAVIALVIWLAWLILTGSRDLVTDRTLVHSFAIAALVHLLCLLFILMAADLARSSLYLQDSRKSLKALWQSIRLLIRRFSATYPLTLLLILAPGLLVILFYWFRSNITAGNAWILLGVVLIQQLFVLARVFLRTWRLASSFACRAHYQ
ncbi:MAG: hypothetical protein R6V75_11550 [Bacteroidales bacterium]